MKILEWNEALVLGCQEIDTHHRKLVGILGKVHQDFVDGVIDIGPVLDELQEYTKYHFRSEELWMLDGVYPEIAAHRREHAFFLNKVGALRKEHDKGVQYLSLETISFLEEWITNHIKKMDVTLACHLLTDASAALPGPAN
ncbi:bacteriohemerythrin [Geomonas sp. Red32]|uniref:bacteriohemerythrin n=1 Tax=Geomonas sp. Red32 TaxID=2912856 RepID=UPI00202CF5D5|nr:bacteriohemerythrin [Geomonas sp. Red32]MCM0080797.1 bacteriohemerythrin [Geomonas sp. Red32]